MFGLVSDVSTDRDRQLRYFESHLRIATSKHHKPYSEKSIRAYLESARQLDRWLTEQDHRGGFDTVDADILNRFFRAYLEGHSQGGTNTRQRNIMNLFNWLVAEEYMARSPYEDKRFARYRADVKAPDVLDDALISALLKVTSGRDYESVRDNAIIRLFLTGMRREQMAMLNVEDLDLIDRTVYVLPQKGADEGHLMPFGKSTAHALNRWLRMRETKKNLDPDSGPLWMGLRRNSRMTGDGLYLMLRRRAVEAGYPKDAVRPHLFRHTHAHQFLEDGGSEGDLMRLHGWKTRQMVDRYGAKRAMDRAIKDAQRRALDDRY
jgi:integrase/recombinase XerD